MEYNDLMREAWEARYRREVLADLARRPIHPFDRVTLALRLNGLSRQLLATRGNPPRVAVIAGAGLERRRWVHDRLAVEFVLLTERRRHRWMFWRRKTIRVIEITDVRIIPGPAPR